MKKLTIIGLLLVIVFAGSMLYWRDVRIAKFDPDFRQQLAGVWVRQEADMQCTNSVIADGSFAERSWFRHPDRTNTYQRTGTWLVKDGHLIETIKTSTNPTEVTPHTNAGRVVHWDESEFVVRWQNSVETIWQRAVH